MKYELTLDECAELRRNVRAFMQNNPQVRLVDLADKTRVGDSQLSLFLKRERRIGRRSARRIRNFLERQNGAQN